MEDNRKTIEQQGRIIQRLRRSCLIRIAALITALVILFTWIAGIGRIESDAMMPALGEGDLVLFLRPLRPACGEMILYRTEEGRRAGQMMAGDRRKSILVMRDRRLESGDPRKYVTIREEAVEGIVLAVLRREK